MPNSSNIINYKNFTPTNHQDQNHCTANNKSDFETDENQNNFICNSEF